MSVALLSKGLSLGRDHGGVGTIAAMTEPVVSLDEQLKEIGAQLDWARGYL